MQKPKMGRPPKYATPTVQVSLRLPRDLHSELKKRGKSLNETIVTHLKAALYKNPISR